AEKILITADALWENGFGVVFPELEGSNAFAEVAATLDMIATLNPDIVIPGHGAVFMYSAEVLARARGRLDYFVRSPIKHARHAAKVLIKFKLLEKQNLSVEELLRWAAETPYVMQIHMRFFESVPSNVWLNELLTELTSSGGVKRIGDRVFSD
ncbi:MAG: MBL fold metallo-hydrolase, partial [Candidatus Omnitrophota bacterium]|nr:MBL fold metallo-hydrolase [Candidatus Omnitrophota bacterium]